MGLRILKTASLKAEKKIDNKYFESILDTNDEWIKTRTGISSRFFAETQTTSEMAVEVSKKLVEGLENKNIKIVLCASFTSDLLIPSVSAKIQKELALNDDTFCADINMACAGFVGAMIMAEKYLDIGDCAIIAASESISKFLDMSDRQTAILFGDGAGGVLVQKNQKKFFTDVRTFGNDKDLNMDKNLKLKMEGKNVYRFAVDKVPQSVAEIMKKAEISANNIDHVLCHQANIRIIEHISKNSKIELNKFHTNLAEFGNTSASSIPILMDQVAENFEENQKILITAFGAGLIVATVLMEW